MCQPLYERKHARLGGHLYQESSVEPRAGPPKGGPHNDGSNEKEATDNIFAHGGARRGFAGKLESARATAPDGATQGDIQDIAWVAWDGSCDPSEVWAEREP